MVLSGRFSISVGEVAGECMKVGERAGRVAVVLGWSAGVVACSKPMSEEEFEQRVDAWAARRASASASPPASGSALMSSSAMARPSGDAHSKKNATRPATDGAEGTAYQTTCLPDEAKAKARATAELLIALEQLMAGFELTLPPDPDRPEKCLTVVAEKNDPEGAKIEALLSADYATQAATSRREAAARLRRFNEVDVPLAWSWVSAIVPGHELEIAPGLLVKEPTELMKRLAARPDLDVAAQQHCIAAQAKLEGEVLLLTCRGPRQSELFYVEVEPAAGAEGGKLATVNIGDLVSFRGQLALTRRVRGNDREARWVWKGLGADGVAVAALSTCCHAPSK